MKKQYVFVGLIPRLFAIVIDLFILAITVTQYIINPLFIKTMKNYFIQHNNSPDNININSLTDISKLPDYQFYQFLSSNEYWYYLFQTLLLHITIFAIYFLGFWIFTNTTPGKFILGLKIVDCNNFSYPSKIQYIKRFLGYSLGLFSIFTIPFTKQHKGIHDKIANTVVIKR